MLFSRFKEYIAEKGIFKKGDRVLAAVSGGADSVCLLHLLVRLRDMGGCKVFCAHINHGIREGAAKDEDFVRKLCSSWNVEFFSKRVDVIAIARDKKISEEMAGREVRYNFFTEVSAANNIDVILTGHNKCDQAETVLLRLIRGSGLTGLAGIAPLREGKVGRPLLCFERFEIEEYIARHNLAIAEDETNKLTIYQRNLLRLEILPYIKKLNPSAVTAIAKCADILRREDNFMDKYAKNCGAYKSNSKETIIFTSAAKKQDIAIIYRIVFLALCEAGVEADQNHVERVLSLLYKDGGSRVSLKGGKVAVSEYGQIAIYKDEDISFCHTIKPGESIYIKEAGTKVTAVPYTFSESPSKNAVLIREGEKIEVRSRRPGDRFCPEGMEGTKKLKDFFIDQKVPKRHRDKIPIITVGGNIAYIANMRRDGRFVPKPHDKAILIHINDERKKTNEK